MYVISPYNSKVAHARQGNDFDLVTVLQILIQYHPMYDWKEIDLVTFNAWLRKCGLYTCNHSDSYKYKSFDHTANNNHIWDHGPPASLTCNGQNMHLYAQQCGNETMTLIDLTPVCHFCRENSHQFTVSTNYPLNWLMGLNSTSLNFQLNQCCLFTWFPVHYNDMDTTKKPRN